MGKEGEGEEDRGEGGMKRKMSSGKGEDGEEDGKEVGEGEEGMGWI